MGASLSVDKFVTSAIAVNVDGSEWIQDNNFLRRQDIMIRIAAVHNDQMAAVHQDQMAAINNHQMVAVNDDENGSN